MRRLSFGAAAGVRETLSTGEDSMQVYDPFPHISVDGSSWLDDAKDLGVADGGQAMASDHENSVVQLLDGINGTQSGRELLSQIEDRCKRAKMTFTIVPYSLADRRREPVGSFPKPDNPRAETRKGQPMYRGGSDIAITPQDERFLKIGIGTGGGSSVRLHFSPDLPYSNDGVVGSDPDEVMFHEMVHALRMLQGELQAVPTGATDDDYDNVEEFLAVLVTNLYMSEKDPHGPLRASHNGFSALRAEESTSDGFLLNNMENLFWIQRLYPSEMRYFHTLAQNRKPKFNPIREYVNNQKTYDVFYAALFGSAVPTTRYTVREGDTLKSIAKSYYQDETKWTVIVAANSRLRRANQQELPAGLVLEIPVLP
jgi:hypothetical protein